MTKQNQTYSKEEKLKAKKLIDELFITGKSVSKYPLRLVYIEVNDQDAPPLQTGVSVSKRHFKKAVDRNYYKRLLRECYRKNKTLILDHVDQKFAMMLFYQTKDRLTYQEVEYKMKALFEKFVRQHQQTSSESENKTV
ncbi:ribonuclease P protein component [Myroides sp. DF42-4-2]|uniref:ribonuclease P protein component n=1 Tax=unclassified Myroides TaxID=2642485 RepID=UPI002577388E|nr:ribonuclease P protein component [Myroides sp. DF42-4-2]MDM1406940.1 ribonuclease P protein component [Myroides sp. DF42-4-2]